MVAVRGKLAFSRTATIPKDNRYEHGPAQRAESANICCGSRERKDKTYRRGGWKDEKKNCRTYDDSHLCMLALWLQYSTEKSA